MEIPMTSVLRRCLDQKPSGRGSRYTPLEQVAVSLRRCGVIKRARQPSWRELRAQGYYRARQASRKARKTAATLAAA